MAAHNSRLRRTACPSGSVLWAVRAGPASGCGMCWSRPGCGIPLSIPGNYAPDRLVADPSRAALSRGLPIAKALAPETLIAFAMNGEPLPRLHGGPLRIVAPGFPGSAWQKWLDRISLRPHEHDGEKMRGTNYRMPSRPVRPGDPLDERRFAVITDMPVKSLVTAPTGGFTIPAGGVLGVSGFAWSGAIPLDGVRVSCDDGGAGSRPCWKKARDFSPGDVSRLILRSTARGLWPSWRRRAMSKATRSRWR